MCFVRFTELCVLNFFYSLSMRRQTYKMTKLYRLFYELNRISTISRFIQFSLGVVGNKTIESYTYINGAKKIIKYPT